MMCQRLNLDLSHSISQLRFPLAMLVVFGHANLLSFPIKGIYPDFDIIQYPIIFFSNILFSTAVPLFFLFSGILFWWNIDTFGKKEYKHKIGKRIKTLLLPYLVWNVIYDLPYISSSLLNIFGGGISLGTIAIPIINLWFCIDQLDRITGFTMTTPIDPPLWFMRDLFICMLGSRLFYKLLKNNKICIAFLFLMLCWWLSGKFLYMIPGLSVPSIFFFGLGSAIGIHKIDIMKAIDKYRKVILITFLILLVIRLLTSRYVIEDDRFEFVANSYLNSLYILISIPSYILIAQFTFKIKFLNLERLAGGSFTLFAIHWMVLHYIRIILDSVINGYIAQWEFLALQFLIYLIPTIVGVALYDVIKRNKKVQLLLNGGR